MPDLKTVLKGKSDRLITTQEQQDAGLFIPEPVSLIGRSVPVVKGRLFEQVDSRYLLAGSEAVQEITARNQSAFDQWINGTLKFIGKTGTAVVGAIAGTADGILESIINRDFSKIYDNHVMNFLNGLNTEMDEALPNLRTKAEQEMSIGRQMLTSNFWADNFLGGASFMVGAVLSEFLTAGLSTPGNIAKAGSVLKILGKSKTATQAIKQAQSLSQTQKALGALRSTIVGAGYESSMEALHARNEIRDSLIEQYREKNGVEPSEQDVAEFTKAANDMANDVFMATLVTVGFSKAVLFSKIFGQPLKNLLPISLLGKGLSKVDGKLVDKSVTGWRKYLTAGKRFIVNPLTEAGEEIAQGIYSSSALDYVMYKYSHDGADASYSIIDSLYANGMDKITGLDKDALKEGIIGGLLGLIGIPGAGNFLEPFKAGVKAIKGESKYQSVIDRYNTLTPNVKENLKGFIRQTEINKTNPKTLHDAKNVESLSLFNLLGSRYNAGYIDDVVSDFQAELDSMSNQEFAQMFGYDKMSKSEIENRKAKAIKSLEEHVKEYKYSRDTAKRLDTTNNEEVEEGLAYTIFGMRDVDKRFDSIINELQEKGIGAQGLKETMYRGNSIMFKQGVLQTKKSKLKQLEKDREDFIKQNKKRISGHKRVITRYGKTARALFEDSPSKKIVEDYEKTLSNMDKMIVKQKKTVEDYEKNLNSFIKQTKKERGTSEIDKDLTNYDNFLKELKHRKELNPEEVSDLEEKVADLNKLALRRQNFIEELNLYKNPKAQASLIESVATLKKNINLETEKDRLSKTKKVQNYLSKGLSEMQDIQTALNTTKNQRTKVQLKKRLDALKEEFSDIENIAINAPSPELAVIDATIAQGDGITSKLFQNMYKVIATGKNIEGVRTEEEKAEDEKVIIEGATKKEETPKKKTGKVVRKLGEFFMLYQDHLLNPNTGEIKEEVKKAISEYENGAPATLKFTEVTEDAIQSNFNDDVFLQRGIVVDGKQYFVNVVVNGQDIGGLLNPLRYTNEEGVPYDFTNPVVFQKLIDGVAVGSDQHKNFIKQYKALKAYWSDVIAYNIKNGKKEIPFVKIKLKTGDIEYFPQLNVYSINTTDKLHPVADIVKEWGVDHQGKKTIFLKWKGNYHIFQDGVWRDYNKNTDSELFKRYKSANDSNTNKKLGEQNSKGMLVNVNGVDKVYPVVFGESDLATDNKITDWIKSNIGNKTATGQLKLEDSRITVAIFKDNKLQPNSFADFTHTKSGLALVIKSPSFGTKTLEDGRKFPEDVYLDIKKNGQTGEYFIQYRDGKDRYTATIGTDPTPENIFNALNQKYAANTPSIADRLSVKYGFDNIKLGMQGASLDKAATNINTEYGDSFSIRIVEDGNTLNFDTVSSMEVPTATNLAEVREKAKGKTTTTQPQAPSPTQQTNVAPPPSTTTVENEFGLTSKQMEMFGVSPSDFGLKEQVSVSESGSEGITREPSLTDIPFATDIKDIDLSGAIPKVEEKEDIPTTEETGDLEFSIVKTRKQQSDIQRETKKIQSVLGEVDVRDIQEVLENLDNRGITMGAFANGVIYLAKDSESGTGWHEAFHYVFRGFLSDKELESLYATAKTKYGKPTKKQLDEFRLDSRNRLNLSESELTRLWYEEKMADDYKSYNEKNVFAKFFNKVKALIKKWLGSIDAIELLFTNINQGLYRNKSSNKFRSGIAFSIRGANLVNDKPVEVGISSKDVKMITSLIYQKTSRGMSFEDAVKEVSSRFDPAKWGKVLFQIKSASDRSNFVNRLLAIRTSLEDTKYLRYHNKEKNLEEYRRLVNAYESIFSRELDEDSAEDQRDETSELFSRGSDRGLGFNSNSRVFRQYLGTLMAEYDYFEIGLSAIGDGQKFPIDADKLYNALLAFNKNLPESKIFKNIKFQSRNNTTVQVFYNHWKSQIANDLNVNNVEELTHEQLKKSQWYNTVVKAVTRVEENYVDGVIMPPITNQPYSKIEFYNSNQNDVEHITKNNWYFRAQLLDVDGKAVWSRVEEILQTTTIGDIATEPDLEKVATEIKDLIDQTGITLSMGYIKYSLLLSNEKSILASDGLDSYKEILDIYKDVIDNPLSAETAKHMITGYSQISGHPSNIFIDPVKGSSGRILNMAQSNAFFDEDVKKTTLKNSNGENVYPIKLPSFDSEMVLFWSSQKEFPTFEQLVEAFPNTNKFLLQDYYESVKKSYITQDKTALKRLKFWNLFGIRNDQIEGEEYQRLYDDSAEYSEMDESGKMFVKISLFIHSPKSVRTKGKQFRLFVPAVLEAKNTAKAVEMPVGNFSKDQNLTDEGVRAIRDRMIVEKERIERVRQQILDSVEYGIPLPILVKDYHYRDFGGRRIVRVDNNFYEFVDGVATEVNETFDYKDVKGLVPFEFRDISLDATDEQIRDWHNKKFQEFVDYISSPEMFIIRKTEDGYKNKLLPYIGDKDAVTNITDQEGNIDLNMLYTFFTSDYINSSHFMPLLYGNIAMQHKDFVDVTKRNGGLIASGESLGSVKVAYIQSEVKDIQNKFLTDNNNNTEFDHQDAQSYMSLAWFKKYLQEGGRYPNNDEAVEKIFNKLRAGVPLTKSEFKKMQRGTLTAIDKKPVIRDLFNYIKTSAHTQLREMYSYYDVSDSQILKVWNDFDKGVIRIEDVHSYYKPYPGYEYHHEMLNMMEREGLEMLSVTSAGKNALVNIGKWTGSKFDITPFEIDNMREQVKMESVKTKIIHGTQLQGLVDAEQNDTKIVDINGKKVKVSDLAKSYREQLNKRVVQGVNKKRKILYKEGDINYDMLDSEFESSINASSPDPMLIEMAQVKNGEPVYSWNMSVVSSKFQQVLHKFLSSQTLSFKTTGTKYTLVSDHGIKVMRDKKGNVVPRNVWDRVTKHETTPLRFGVQEGGIFYSEAIVPQWILDKYGIKLGEEIKDPKLLYQVGIRIPTQDKHSMVTLKVVDTMPSMNETSIIVPAEVVFLSGADFDIDSLFARMFAITGSKKRFGTYTTVAEAYEEFVYDALDGDKDTLELIKLMSDMINLEIDEIRLDFKQANIETVLNNKGYGYNDFVTKYGKQVELNIKHREAGDYAKIEPVTIKEADNLLLELEMNLVMNEGNKNIASTKESLDLFKDKVTGAIKYFEDLGLIGKNEVQGIYDAISKNKAQRNNDAGKQGIGPVALFNILYQKLVRANFKYNFFGYTGTVLTNQDGQRMNHIISTVLSAMADNAKEVIAAKFNIDDKNLGAFMTLVGTGIPFKDALLVMNQPVIKELYSQISSQNRTVQTTVEESKQRKGKNNFDTAVLRTIDKLELPKIEDYKVTNLHKQLEDGVTKEMDKEFQAYILNVFNEVNTLSEKFRHASAIASLIKGLKPTIHDNKAFRDSLNSLGLGIFITEVGDKIDGFQIKGNVAFFNRGNKNYKVSIKQLAEGGKPWFMEVLETDSHLMAEVLAYATLSDDVGRVFIRATNQFESMVNDINNHTAKYMANNDKDRLEDYLISYMNIVAYNNLKGYNPDLRFLYKKQNDEFVLHSVLKILKNSEEFGNSTLIKMIKESAADKIGLAKLQIDTMSEQSPDFKKSLINDYVNMLDPNIKFDPINNYIMADNFDPAQLDARSAARWFAQTMFNYTFVMDNMIFRNNSLVKTLDPLVWKNYSNAMKEVEKVFNGEKNFKSVFGKTKSELLQEFTELYLRNPARYTKRVYANAGTILNSKRSGLGKEWFSYNLVEGELILDFSTKGKFESGSIEAIKYILKIKQDAATFGLYQNGNVPLLFNFKTGKLTQLMRLDRINVSRDNKFLQYRRVANGQFEVFVKTQDNKWVTTGQFETTIPTDGYRAVYKPVNPILSKDFVGFAQDITNAESLTEQLVPNTKASKINFSDTQTTSGESETGKIDFGDDSGTGTMNFGTITQSKAEAYNKVKPVQEESLGSMEVPKCVTGKLKF